MRGSVGRVNIFLEVDKKTYGAPFRLSAGRVAQYEKMAAADGAAH